MEAVLRRVALMCAGLVLGVCGVANAAPAGQITEFPTAGGVSAVAAGPDGNEWFAGGTAGVGRITPDGHITMFTNGLPGGAGGLGMAAGPDGNLWFIASGPAIGRITPNGQITEFSAGLNTGAAPEAIAAGPDGNTWFTDNGSVVPAIGRITPDGQIAEMTSGVLQNNFSFLGGIAAGPDGNMWFTDPGTGSIGRIAVDDPNPITEFGGGGNTDFIAAGPDGNMWFTDANGAIGVITMTGQITKFSAGLSAGSAPEAIALGPDGNMWFTDEGTNSAIGRITPTGVVTEFSDGLSAGGLLLAIAPGADGNLWFGDATREIGRIGTGEPAASLVAPLVAGPGETDTQQVCEGDRWADWAGQQPSLAAFPEDGYQWSIDGTPLPGQTARTFTPGSLDAGHKLTCTVTVTYPLLGVTDSATSAPVTLIASAPGPIAFPGPPGSPGSPGAAGLQGPPGQVELVTCTTHTKTVRRHHKKVKVKQQKCTAKLVSGPVTFTSGGGRAHATLSRGRVVYATGYDRGGRTRLVAARPLRPGRYTLTLTSARGPSGSRSRSVVMID